VFQAHRLPLFAAAWYGLRQVMQYGEAGTDMPGISICADVGALHTTPVPTAQSVVGPCLIAYVPRFDAPRMVCMVSLSRCCACATQAPRCCSIIDYSIVAWQTSLPPSRAHCSISHLQGHGLQTQQTSRPNHC